MLSHDTILSLQTVGSNPVRSSYPKGNGDRLRERHWLSAALVLGREAAPSPHPHWKVHECSNWQWGCPVPLFGEASLSERIELRTFQRSFPFIELKSQLHLRLTGSLLPEKQGDPLRCPTDFSLVLLQMMVPLPFSPCTPGRPHPSTTGIAFFILTLGPDLVSEL